jgi:transcriptional regulator with XRE-family HTH domain
LRKLRLASGMSQEQLAEKSRMHRNHVSFLERGLECPSLAKVFDLAEALAIPPGELVAAVSDATQQLYQACEPS